MKESFYFQLGAITNIISKLAIDLNLTLSKRDLLFYLKAIRHYVKHAKGHNLNVTAIEPYKVISWGSFELCQQYKKTDQEKAKKILMLAVVSLNYFLLLDVDKKVDISLQKKILRMLIYECRGNNEFGIGKNGLYLIFKTASFIGNF